MAPQRVMVVGGTGLVGNALVREWQRRGAAVTAATYHCHPSPDFQRLDMQDEAAVRLMIKEAAPGVVAVPAANPYVDYCELHPQETRRVNVEGTLNVGRAARDAGVPMVFFSSDYVFDGRKDVYTEEDPVCPLNEYGRQKAEAEAGVLALSPRNLVVRTSGAYGWQWEPKNFVLQVRATLAAGEPMNVAADLFYNPTSADNLAQTVADLSEAGASGVFHVVGADRVGRHEFAVKVARAFGLDAALLRPVPSAEVKSPTPRPRSSSMSTEKVRALTRAQPWGVDEGLRRMKESEAAWRQYAKRLPGLAQERN